jgi:hypothetical protein
VSLQRGEEGSSRVRVSWSRVLGNGPCVAVFQRAHLIVTCGKAVPYGRPVSGFMDMGPVVP